MKAEYAGYADMKGGDYPNKKKKSVADQFAAVKNRSETYCWTKKNKQGRLRGGQVLDTFFF